MNTSNLSQHILPHIFRLVAELESWIERATRLGVRDDEAEVASLREDALNRQLNALGWGAVLNENGRWVPVPTGYAIVGNAPDPYFYPQRRYRIPEGPDQWRALQVEAQEVRFTNWRDAYAFVFRHLAQEQAQLPRKRYCVRPPNTCGGNDYVTTSADQALQMHQNYWISLGWITAQRALDLDLVVFEHCGDQGFYCRACQFAPCKYTPGEKWPLPPVSEG